MNTITARLLSPLIVFLISLFIYAFTSAPDVMFTDAGELAGACVSLGVAHPSGYPLFVLLGHVFTLLPLPLTPIQKLNLFVAIITAGSAVVFLLVSRVLLQYLKQISTDRMAQASPTVIELVAVASALTYAFARTIWNQATSLEVYALHCLLLLGTFYFFLRGMLEQRERLLYGAALMLGLGFTNHLTTVLLLPGLIFLYFLPPGKKANVDTASLMRFGKLILVTASTGLLYLLPVLRSSQGARFNWGDIHRSWHAFSYHVLGEQYHVFLGESAISTNTGKFISLLPHQFGWIGLVFAVYGLIQLLRKSPRLAGFLLINTAACLAYSLSYGIHDIESYFALAFIALLLLMALGVAELVAHRQQLAPLFLVLPVANLLQNFGTSDLSRNTLVPDYTRLLTQDLPPDSILISAQWDYFDSAFWYKQQVEGYRKDIIAIDKELLRRTWYLGELKKWYPQLALNKAVADAYLNELQKFENDEPYDRIKLQHLYITLLNSLIASNYKQHPVYITREVLNGETGFTDGYNKIPNGLRLRLIRSGDQTQVPEPVMNVTSFAKAARRYCLDRPGYKADIVDRGICESVIDGLNSEAIYLAKAGKQQQAKSYVESMLMVNPRLRAVR